MSMDSLVFGVIRPPPASCDERGKQVKQHAEPESESESESEQEEESESESESECEQEAEEESETKPKLPPLDFDSTPIEEFVWSDFSSRYDDYPCAFCFAGPHFTYTNAAYKAYKQQEEATDKAVAEYMDMSRGISPYDAIPVPRLANVCGNNFPKPLSLTEDRIPLFTRLSQLALEDYNAKNQDQMYDFYKLLKATRQRIPLVTYYITFEAKLKHNNNNAPNVDPSNCPAATFQAQVWDKITGDPQIEYCSIKNTCTMVINYAS